MSDTKPLTTQISDMALNCDPYAIALPPVTYDELVDLEKTGCEEPTYDQPPFCYGARAKFDDDRYSTQARIDNCTIPLHLVDLIQRDNFDLGELEGRIVGARLGYEFRAPATEIDRMKERCQNQSAAEGNMEAVFYSRKRKASGDDEDESPPARNSEQTDERGRMIERVVWSRRTKHHRARARAPTGTPVYQGAATSSPSLARYQYRSATPLPLPEAVEFEQMLLFSSRKKPSKYSGKARRTLTTLKARKTEIASEPARHGGLMIQLAQRIRRNYPSNAFSSADQVTDEYANAFEDWDEDMRNSIKEYESDEGKRKWFRGMWEMPARARGSVWDRDDGGDEKGEGEGGREDWADDEWEGRPL